MTGGVSCRLRKLFMVEVVVFSLARSASSDHSHGRTVFMQWHTGTNKVCMLLLTVALSAHTHRKQATASLGQREELVRESLSSGAQMT